MALPPKERLSVLRLQISIMQEKMRERNITHDKLTSRMFTLLGTELAISGLFTSPLIAIPYPHTHAGKIFFYGAVSLMAISVGLLMFHFRSRKVWPSPMGENEVALMNKSDSELEALQILYDDYRFCYNKAQSLIAPKAWSINASLLLFAAGAIILIVLKFGG